MRKAFGWFVRTLFGLLLIGLVGYNTLETARLRAKVEALERREGFTASGPVPSATPAAATSEGSDGPLAAARRHAEQAEESLRRGDYSGARREMERVGDSIRRANADTQARSQQVVDDLRTQVAALSSKLDALTGRNAAGGAGRH
jgi:hypothetical protein